jgi:hypothetical protein
VFGAISDTAATNYNLSCASGSFAVTGTAADLVPAELSYFGQSSAPPDTGSLGAPGPRVVTPPASMLTGDLVLLYGGFLQPTETLSISEAGGQTWNAETRSVGDFCQVHLFWCRYNGTWSANPSIVASGGTTALTAWMLVFRPSDTSREWEIDVPQAIGNGLITTQLQDLTIASPGSTTVDNTMVIAMWGTTNDRLFSLQTSGWANPSNVVQVRNDYVEGFTLAAAYKFQLTAGAVGAVTNQQDDARTGSYATSIIAFRSIATSAYTLVADPGAVAVTGTDAGLTYTPGSVSLTCDAGSVAVTGTAASFIHTVLRDPGAIVVTGTATVTAAAYSITADTILFTVSGTDAGLDYVPIARALTCESGGFVVVGSPVNTVYSAQPALNAVPGIVVSVGLTM